MIKIINILLSPCVPATCSMIYVYFLIKSSMRPVLLLPPLQRTWGLKSLRNLSMVSQLGLKMVFVCLVFFVCFFSSSESDSKPMLSKHIYSGNIKKILRLKKIQEPCSPFHWIFQSTHDFDLAKRQLVPNKTKFNILNYPWLLTPCTGMTDPHGNRVSGESTRSVYNSDGMLSHLEMKVIALNLATKSKSFLYSLRVFSYPDHCPNLLWHWKVFITIKED